MLINSIKYISALLFAMFVLVACKKDLSESVPLSELGTQTKEYIVGKEAGNIDVKVLSNTRFQVNIPDENSWIRATSKEYSGDTAINFEYQENTSFARMSLVSLYSKEHERYDTIYIKQKGVEEAKLAFPKLNTTVLGDGGSMSVDLNSNVPFEEVQVQVIYPDASVQPWVNTDFSYDIANSKLLFSVKPNTDPINLRSVQIKLMYTNGWGEELVSMLYILQANANNEFGTLTSFTDVREWAGERISADIYIEGHIISDAKNQNASEFIQTTPTAINYATNNRVTYIQSLDGKYGFKIVTNSDNDNIFQRYSKVQLLLKGTSISKESNPDFYTINGVTSTMVMSQEQGTAGQLPAKSKTMSELNDDDIFTFVTLKDTEFPIRKGSFTPINEGYSTLFTAHRIGKYPLLMRDIQGNSMFLMTNTTVAYRRDGDILPYGSGHISGVIVHEKFTRFEYNDAPTEDQFGNIGRYQMRHLSKSDIQFKKDITQGFSGLLSEFQYPEITNGVASATFGNGTIRSSVSTLNFSKGVDYSYLGPVGRTELGNTNQYGNGVMIGSTKQNQETGTNSDGKGVVTAGAIIGNTIWWNEAKQRGEAFILEVSTRGISTNQLSLQFAISNLVGGTGKGSPRHWKVEWSEHGDMDKSWTNIAPFTVPDMPLWANTNIHQLAAYKNINVKLPLAMLDKPSVFIRLIVDRNLSSDGNTYASEPITESTTAAISYLGIRYNK